MGIENLYDPYGNRRGGNRSGYGKVTLESFEIRRWYWDKIKELHKEQKQKVLEWILDYMFEDITPDYQGEEELQEVFEDILTDLSRQKNHF